MTDFVTFIRTHSYEAAVKGVLTTEEERERIEKPLAENPQVGSTIAGTGGFRKLRVALRGRGKSGGARLVYYFVGATDRIYLVDLFSKNEKANLSKAERNALKALAAILEDEG